jgi:hypothetical protein
MSGNPTTNFIVKDASNNFVDLSNVFQQYTSGTQAETTNFIVSGIGDLNTIFKPLESGTPIDFSTNLLVNGVDLNSIFHAI